MRSKVGFVVAQSARKAHPKHTVAVKTPVPSDGKFAVNIKAVVAVHTIGARHHSVQFFQTALVQRLRQEKNFQVVNKVDSKARA